jgi:hypothetical protein
MTSPWLLTESCWSYADADLRRIALDKFGELASQPSLPATDLLDHQARVPRKLQAEWQSRVAEEILLAAAAGRHVDEAVWTGFAQIQPFGPETPPLGRLRGPPAAAAVIPQNRQRAKPPAVLTHVWVIEDPDGNLGEGHARFLDRADAFPRLRLPDPTESELSPDF